MNLMLYLAYISLIACKDLYQKPSTTMHYRAVEGEEFMMPCMSWSRVEGHRKKNLAVTKNSFVRFNAEAADSGNYTCNTSAGLQFLHLQVVNITLGCSSVRESRVTLEEGVGGQIPCPGHDCSNSSTTVWYKGNRRVSEMRRGKEFFSNGSLHLHEVSRHDSDVFFCDRVLSELGVNWTLRRSVTVKALDRRKRPPRILYPANDTVEVELGLNHTLKCEVYFPEADPPGVVQWFMINNGQLMNLTTEQMEKQRDWEIQVIGKVIIKQATAQDLNKTYVCITQNTSGNNSATIYLKKKNKVQWSSLIEYSLGPILFVTGLGIVVRVKWMEIQLVLKSRWTKQDGGHKDFDVFLSYVWRTSSTEQVSSPQRYNSHDAAFPFSLDPLEVEVPSERLELLLPHVLEDLWGYRLCLMDRDFLPGGAYTKDVANAIQRSQMLICLLSAEYLSDNNAVFVLESGVQALLQNSGIKLQLIWANKAPVSVPQLDPPLPVAIQKALKVLPALKWTSATNTNFWRCLRKAMPQRLSSLQK